MQTRVDLFGCPECLTSFQVKWPEPLPEKKLRLT
jgi:hypothetical protein